MTSNDPSNGGRSRGDEDDTLQEIHRKDGTKVLVAS